MFVSLGMLIYLYLYKAGSEILSVCALADAQISTLFVL